MPWGADNWESSNDNGYCCSVLKFYLIYNGNSGFQLDALALAAYICLIVVYTGNKYSKRRENDRSI